MNTTRRRFALSIASTALALPGLAHRAFADDGAAGYPERPVRVLVPYTPGGSPDVLARLLMQQIGARTGKVMVVENKPGANGAIALQAAAGSLADGYTVVVADTGHLSINPALYKKLPYDPVRDFAPVTLAASTPFFVIVNSQMPVQTFPQLLEHIRRNPGKLSYGSSGNGSPQHLATALLAQMAGLQLTHIPYKGVAESVPALVGGQIDLLVVALPSVASSIQAGKLRPLAVTTLERSKLMPDIPTVAESGLPGYEMVSRIGFLMPAGTPTERVAWMAQQIDAAVSDGDISRRMVGMGMEPVRTTPAEYAAIIRDDLPKFRASVEKTGIRVD